MSICRRTLAASTLTALIVSAAVSQGASAPLKDPKPTHGISTAVTSTQPLPLAPAEGPSDHDRLVALIKRVDRLQIKLARTSETANVAADDAANALGLTGCITGGVQIDERFDGTLVDSRQQDDGTEPIDSWVVPTLSDDCVTEIS